jgi:hypothetical protein
VLEDVSYILVIVLVIILVFAIYGLIQISIAEPWCIAAGYEEAVLYIFSEVRCSLNGTSIPLEQAIRGIPLQ